VLADPRLQTYAREQISKRLGKLVYQVKAVEKSPAPEAVHDLRVAIRRFNQSLSVFSSILPPRAILKTRKRLKSLMDAAGTLRDRDVTLLLLEEAGFKSKDPLCKQLASERRAAKKTFLQSVKQLGQTNYSAKWRRALELSE